MLFLKLDLKIDFVDMRRPLKKTMFQVSFIAWQADHLSKWTKIRNRLVSKSLTLSQETRDIIYRPQILHGDESTPQPHQH